MPVSELGQLITFAVEEDPDTRYKTWIWAPVNVGDTIQKIAARRGHPEDARAIADKNGIRSVRSKLSRKTVKVPGSSRNALSFNVLPGEAAPVIVGGYAKFSTVDRPQRVGLTKFDGFDPITMDIAVRFESWQDRDGGVQLERDIELLEGMAGRGRGRDAVGAPPTVRISTTGASGQIVPLVPANYQWTSRNQAAPVWYVANIDWDAEPLRSGGGRRLRQLATVSVQQATRTNLATSLAARNKGKK
jgi:hypothetical protein